VCLKYFFEISGERDFLVKIKSKIEERLKVELELKYIDVEL
jgi:hypothetical protein